MQHKLVLNFHYGCGSQFPGKHYFGLSTLSSNMSFRLHKSSPSERVVPKCKSQAWQNPELSNAHTWKYCMSLTSVEQPKINSRSGCVHTEPISSFWFIATNSVCWMNRCSSSFENDFRFFHISIALNQRGKPCNKVLIVELSSRSFYSICRLFRRISALNFENK